MPPYDAIDMCAAGRLGFLTVCALAATVSRAGTPPGHEPQEHSAPRFFISTQAVRVDVSVRRSDHPVTGLQAADFDVRDDGVPQDVELIGYEELPLDLALVLDTSGSVKGARLRHLIDAAEAVFDGVKLGDRVALLAFSDTVYLQITPTEDIERVRRAVGGLKAGGMTALLDATYASLALATAPGRRVAVILFTDGIDTNSTRIASVVLEACKHSDVTIYAVAATGDQLDKRFLQSVADATGGRVFFENDRALRAAFLALLTGMKNRYLLSYRPTGVDHPGWHQVTVRLKSGNAEVTSRPGYYR